jgi:hypothetical protein
LEVGGTTDAWEGLLILNMWMTYTKLWPDHWAIFLGKDIWDHALSCLHLRSGIFRDRPWHRCGDPWEQRLLVTPKRTTRCHTTWLYMCQMFALPKSKNWKFPLKWG